MQMTDIVAKYKRMRIALEYRLMGMDYYTASSALHYAAKLNIDKHGNLMLRKDGKTPKFYHEVRQALHALTLKGVEDLEGLVTTILLHDVMEDFGIEKEFIRNRFGIKNFNSAWAMTKKYQGIGKSPDQVFDDIGNDPNASIAKLLDRIDNYQSMPEVFSREKQLDYLHEGVVYFLPMGKRARKNFPTQTDAYFNVETVLKYQIELLSLLNAAPT
jgi:(p)ppGpp synthase/HD superfamily hydrolase